MQTHTTTEVDAGLSTAEAERRLREVGPNRVVDHRESPLWRLALAQFKSLVVLLLFAAAAVAATLGERVEAITILAALVLNAAIGFAAEWRARVSLARLRELAVPQALVRRDGHPTHVAAVDLVPGDVLLLDAAGPLSSPRPVPRRSSGGSASSSPRPSPGRHRSSARSKGWAGA